MRSQSTEPDLLVKIDGNLFPADYVAGRRSDINATISHWRRTEQTKWPQVDRNLKGWRIYWAWPEQHNTLCAHECFQS